MKKTIKTAVLTAALVAGALSPLAARADTWFQFESGIGVTAFQTENGRWYQNGMPQSRVSRVAPEYSAGITGPLLARGAWGADWHVDYVNLGRAAASCQCDTSDADYAAHTTKHTAYYTGDGRAQGAALTIEPYGWVRGVRVAAEGGAFIYHAGWSESVTGWSVGGPPQNLYLSQSQWAVAPVAGVSVGNGTWSVNFRHYFLKANNKTLVVPPVWNDANVIELKYRY